MKPEQHKVIAKAMGLKSHIHDLLGCRAEVNKYWVVWNPETNAEQTLMVLEHFKIDTEYDEINKEWLAIKGADGIIIVCKRHKDFQTAVCMAAYEYINQ